MRVSRAATISLHTAVRARVVQAHGAVLQRDRRLTRGDRFKRVDDDDAVGIDRDVVAVGVHDLFQRHVPRQVDDVRRHFPVTFFDGRIVRPVNAAKIAENVG